MIGEKRGSFRAASVNYVVARRRALVAAYWVDTRSTTDHDVPCGCAGVQHIGDVLGSAVARALSFPNESSALAACWSALAITATAASRAVDRGAAAFLCDPTIAEPRLSGGFAGVF